MLNNSIDSSSSENTTNSVVRNKIKNKSDLPLPSQIFKNDIPVRLLSDLFEKICIKHENYYTLNNNAYKKGIFKGDIQQFISDCLPYYYLSKRKYLTRPLNYNHFITIIRQICKYLNIKYTNKIVYEKSTYDIIYNVYL
jgi:hypothetical protein